MTSRYLSMVLYISQRTCSHMFFVPFAQRNAQLMNHHHLICSGTSPYLSYILWGQYGARLHCQTTSVTNPLLLSLTMRLLIIYPIPHLNCSAYVFFMPWANWGQPKLPKANMPSSPFFRKLRTYRLIRFDTVVNTHNTRLNQPRQN